MFQTMEVEVELGDVWTMLKRAFQTTWSLYGEEDEEGAEGRDVGDGGDEEEDVEGEEECVERGEEDEEGFEDDAGDDVEGGVSDDVEMRRMRRGRRWETT